MGAPKQKWTAEEEAALKAGIRKYGIGKWSTILKDPEFSTVLRARSNVDLKDKYRNLNCMAIGSGSRHRSKVPNRSNQPSVKQAEDTSVRSVNAEKDSEVLDGTSFAASCEISQGTSSKKEISRVDDHILEAITKLKEPRGSSRATIAQYIGDHYLAPPDLDKSLAANLKVLTENGRLVKVKNQYRIAPRSLSFTARKEPQQSTGSAVQKDPSEAESNHNIVLLTKEMIDAELEKMKGMSPEEAAKAAAQAVAEAEAAIAEAEAAAKEAEDAEAEAEAARCFAEAAEKALTFPSYPYLNPRLM